MDNIVLDLVAGKINAATSGNREAAIWLLKEFISTVQQNRKSDGTPHVKPSGIHTQFDERLLDYLAKCFGVLVNSKKGDNLRRPTADQALHLASNGKRGKQASKETRKKTLLRGKETWDLYKSKSRKKDLPSYQGRNVRPNKHLEAAIRETAKLHNLAENTLIRDYNKWRALVQSLEDANT